MPDWSDVDGLMTVWDDGWGEQLVEDYAHVEEAARNAWQEWVDDFGDAIPTPSCPGYLGLRYNDIQGVSHKTRYRLMAGQDPLNYSTMIAGAMDIAPYLAASLPSIYHVEGFFTQDILGHSLQDSLLSTSFPGQRATAGVNMYSFSWTITGRTVDIGADVLPGNELTRIFPQYFPVPPLGAKGIPLSADITILNYAAALATSAVCWADYLGRKAGIRPVAPIQSNAAVQRRRGW